MTFPTATTDRPTANRPAGNRPSASDLIATVATYRVVFILAATVILSSSIVPGFFSKTTLSITMDQAASLGIIAVGLTVLLIAGQIDLSSGAIFALTGIVAIEMQGAMGPIPGAVVGALVGAGLGAINGVLVVVFRINSLVATLATLLAIRAVAHWLTDSQPISGDNLQFALTISRPLGGLLTPRTIILLVLIVCLHFWLTATEPGRNVFAVGSNADAATASGVRAGRYVFGGFVFAGLCAGIAGVMQSLSVNTGSPVFGETLTVTVIAAVVVGGTRLEGGRGSAFGTLGGVLTLAGLTTAMEFESVPAYTQQVVTGTILLVLILLDRVLAEGRGRSLRIRSLVSRSRRSGDEAISSL